MDVDQVDLIQLHNLVEPDEWESRSVRAARSRRSPRRATRGSCASSASPVTGCASPRCTSAASSGSTSTRCCCPTTSRCRQIEEYRRELDRLLELCAERAVAVQTIKAIARRRWHDSNPSRVQLVRAADGSRRHRPRRALRAGRSAAVLEHDERRPPAAPASSTPRGEHSTARPTTRCVADDEAFGISPLFDGSELERI